MRCHARSHDDERPSADERPDTDERSGERATEGDGRELVRIQLRDAAYPFEVALCFRTYREQDVIEQWTEIQHREGGEVTMEQMASIAAIRPGSSTTGSLVRGHQPPSSGVPLRLASPSLSRIDAEPLLSMTLPAWAGAAGTSVRMSSARGVDQFD